MVVTPLQPGALASLSGALRWLADAGVSDALAPSPAPLYGLARLASLTSPPPPPASKAAPPAPPPAGSPLGNKAEPLTPPARSPLASKVASPLAPLAPPSAPASASEAALPLGGLEGRMKAQSLADGAASLTALEEALRSFDDCPLKDTAASTVFARGEPQARLMLVGEAPGDEEDRQGLPFVGRSGRLLDLILASIGIERDQARIGNILPWRPPGNRQPTAAEIALCAPFIIRHIELVNPRVLVLLGGVAAQALLGRREGITRLRKRWFSFQSPGLARPLATRPTFHPAYLLRAPGQKRQVWSDMLEIKSRLESESPS